MIKVMQTAHAYTFYKSAASALLSAERTFYI